MAGIDMEKILIIEDDKAYIENITILLEEEGYNVISAGNGFDGIDLAKNEIPDLIICDIVLPDIDGYAILKELRRREKTKLIPFIFLTAKAAMSDLRTGMNLGADDYLIKPFQANDLLTSIKTRLEKSQIIIEAANKSQNSTSARARLEPDDYVVLPSKANYEVLPVNKIVFISSDGVYSNVFSMDGNKVLVRKLLKEWEATLPQKLFFRIHKSTLVNLQYIKKIERWFNGCLRTHMVHYPEPLIVSRRYAALLKKRI